MLSSCTPRRQPWELGWGCSGSGCSRGKLGFIFALGFYDTHVDYVEDSGLFFFVGISFSPLASFAGKILLSLVSSWRTGTVLIFFGLREEVPRKGFPKMTAPLGRGLRVHLGIASNLMALWNSRDGVSV